MDSNRDLVSAEGPRSDGGAGEYGRYPADSAWTAAPTTSAGEDKKELGGTWAMTNGAKFCRKRKLSEYQRTEAINAAGLAKGWRRREPNPPSGERSRRRIPDKPK
jgi:hypothetical protein